MKTTKELARELGLLRKRTYSTSSAVRNRGINVQQFKYLIVIDFESTCWQDTKFRPQEIIEFPAVLLNTLSGEVESEFHFYVQPQEYPVLSNFCTDLTGITQTQVDNGIPVNLCLRKFTHWLDKLYREQGVVCEGTKTEQTTPINCTFVTWSDWDLGVCLQYECKRKQLLKPSQLNTWIDLRATYRKFYDRKPNGLNGALQDLGIEFQGREHSGADDARNTAKLAYRMVRDGCILKNTKTLKSHQRSTSCNVQFKEAHVQNRQAASVTSPKPVRGRSDIRNFVQTNKSPAGQTSKSNTPAKTSNANKVTTPKSKLPKPHTPKSKSAKPQTPKVKQISRIPTPTKTLTPSKCKTPKKKITPNKASSTKTPNSKLTPQKAVINNTNHDNTPNRKQINANSKTSSKLLTYCDNGMSNLSKTPVKRVQESVKRKTISPIKTVNDVSCLSPIRKIPRRISPKKLSTVDIYRDPEPMQGISPSKAKCKTGLQMCDMNVKNNDATVSNKTVTKKTFSGTMTQSKTVKKPSPSKTTTQIFQNEASGSGTNTFKVPLPVDKMVSPRQSVKRKSFSTSTPLSGKSEQHILTPGSRPSPIQAQHTPYNYNQSTNSTNSMNKTASTARGLIHTNGISCTSSGAYVTPNTGSFSSTNSYSRFGTSGTFNSSNSTMKMTPPLCNCGRRSKRRMVQSPGQNMGRFFFTCTVRQSVGSKKGCDFFKWESSLNFNKNVSARNVSKQYTPVLGNKLSGSSYSLSGSGSQKRSLGVRSNSSQRVYLR